jgi:hypothetical protein
LEAGGMVFPKVAPSSTAGAKLTGVAAQTQGTCTPGQTRSLNVASIDISSPNNMARDKQYPAEGPIKIVYSPPDANYVISSYSRVQLSGNHPYQASDSAQPGHFVYLTASEYQSAFEQMKEYVLKLNILDKYKADMNLKLEEFVKNYGKYSLSLSTSHSVVEHTALLHGAGWLNGRSWYKGYIYVTEICAPTEVRDEAQLKMTLTAWVDQTASKLPKGTLGRSLDTKNIPAAPRTNQQLNPKVIQSGP